MSVVVRSASTGPNIVRDGLVLYLDAANTKSYPSSGTDWYDLSGNGNHGTMLNGVGYNTSNLGSMTFDGVDDYVDVYGDFQPLSTTDGFAVEFIYKLNAVNDTVFSGNLDLPNRWFQTPISTSGAGAYLYFSSGGVVLSTDTNFYINPQNINKYYHVIMNYTWNDINRSYILINGIDLTSSKTSVAKFDSGGYSTIRLGRRGTSIWPLDGNLSMYRYYNRSLTQDEIKQNYNALKGRYGL